MNELRASIELNTPAVLGGARPRRCDPYFKVRPSAVRGGLRYWFRAAAASLLWPDHDADPRAQRGHDNDMLAQLRELEAQVFGDTGRRSKVIVLPPDGGTVGPWRPTPKPQDWPGLRYLGYGLFEDKRRAPECVTTQPGQPIELRLVLRDDLPSLRAAVAASLWLWTTFGGLGARARRGFGSMRLAKLEGEGGSADFGGLCELSASSQAHLELLQRGIGLSQDAVTQFVQAMGIGKGLLSNTGQRPHPYIRTIDGIARLQALHGELENPLEVLEFAGDLFQRYRSSIKRKVPLPDYHAVKQSLQPPYQPPRTVERADFGMPLNFYFRSLGGAKAQFLPRAPTGQDDPDRLASPLLFRVHALQPKPKVRRYGVTLINLAGRNTSPLLGCTLRSSRGKEPISAPSLGLLDAFIDWAVKESKQRPPRPKSRGSHSRRRR